MSSVFDDFLHPPEVQDAFGAQRFVAAMLRVEAALAQAQAQCGLVPASAALSIVGTCKVDLFDAPKIVRDSGRAGSLAIPLVKSLKETVGLFNPDAVPYVHFACTKQDLVDTATVLITRDLLERLRSDVQQCIQRLQTLGTPEDAAPLQRALQRLEHSASDALTVQLGGTLAQSPQRGTEVVALVAQQLGLAVPAAPWHTQRDAWVALGCDVGLLIGSLGTLAKGMARDASTDSATDAVPAGCLLALAMARRAPQRVASLLASMPEAFERSLGVWQSEQADWAQLLMSAHASANGMWQALQGDARG